MSDNPEELLKQVAELKLDLKKNKVFFDTIINNIPQPIFYKNPEGKYTGCNEAFADFLGMPHEKIMGATVYDVSPGEMADIYHKADLELLDTKGKLVYESKVLHADNTYHDVIFKKTYFESEDGSEKGIVGIILDITQRKANETKIKNQNEEYQQLNIKYTERNEELKKLNTELVAAKEKAVENDRLKSVFLANMSHEIRTPLNGILGFAELLRDSEVTADDRMKYLDIIKNRGNLLLKIINDIIDISKLDSGESTLNQSKVSLNNVINDIYKAFYSKKAEEGKEGINLRVFKELENGRDIIEVDSVKLQQVLTNLIENAFKFTKKGHIDFGYEVTDKNLKFFVKDTGKGIPNENLEMIFERFRQEDESPTRKYGGAGLGLTICKAFIELMGGKIWVESAKDSGTTFFFMLPHQEIKDETPKPPVKKEKEEVSYDWSGKSILIVEDDYASYEFLRNILAKTKAEFYWVDNGRKAIETFFVNTSISIVLMDINLPDVDGYYATREIKSISPDTPIIAQTAHAFPEDEEKCKAAGCDGFITKPIKKDKLLKLMNYFLTTD